MSVYKKLSFARKIFHCKKLVKSGKNTFSGYSYFELSDFLTEAMSSMEEAGICPVISFEKDSASMTIFDVDKPDEKIVIASPMAEANLKGCHPIQNLGAVQTYIRRYLWVCAMEIIEHDAVDRGGNDERVKIIKPVESKVQITDERKSIIKTCIDSINELFNSSDIVGAYEVYTRLEDQEEKIYLWSMLPSNVRAAIKKHGKEIKENV